MNICLYFLGINEVRKCLPNLNARLGVEDQANNVKGHSGRRSFITNGLEAGIPPEIIAQSTKHKDPKTLMAYAEKSDTVLGAAGLLLSKQLNRNDDSFFGGHARNSSSSTSIDTRPPVGSIPPLLPSLLSLDSAMNSSSSSSTCSFAKSSVTTNTIVAESAEKKIYTLNFTFN